MSTAQKSTKQGVRDALGAFLSERSDDVVKSMCDGFEASVYRFLMDNKDEVFAAILKSIALSVRVVPTVVSATDFGDNRHST